MLAMAVPFYVLYETSIHLCTLFERRDRKKKAERIKDESPSAGETAG